MNTVSRILYENAVKNIWGNPHGDYRSIFKAARISNVLGSQESVKMVTESVMLPLPGVSFVVYTLGNPNTGALGLDTSRLGWYNLDKLFENEKINIRVYIKGRSVIRSRTYINFMLDGTILIAIDRVVHVKLFSFKDDLFVKFYSNIHFNQPDTNTNAVLKSIVISEDLSQYLEFVTNYNVLNSKLLYLNGLLLLNGIPERSKLVVGDYLEYFDDPYVVDIQSSKLADLNTYQSSLDRNMKVVLSSDLIVPAIYVDDIDFFVSGIRSSDNLRIGVLFPRNNPGLIRQLTDVDYGLDSMQVSSIVNDITNFIDTGDSLIDIELHMLLRDNGEHRANSIDSNRLKYLLDTDTEIRLQTLTGINSNLALWRASELENSVLNKWIGNDAIDLTLDNLKGVYSRDGAISVLERVYIRPGDDEYRLPNTIGSRGGKFIKLKDTIIPSIEVYDNLNHTNEVVDSVNDTAFFIPGSSINESLDIYIPAGSASDTLIEKDLGVLVYYRNDTLITGRSSIDYDLVDTENGTNVVWRGNIVNYDRYIRIANRSSIFTITLNANEVTNGINVYQDTDYINDVGLSTLMVWLNGRYLIETLDYVLINDTIFITYLEDNLSGEYIVDVIYTGLPNKSLKHEPPTDWGWILYGYAKYNEQYDLLNDRNKIFFVDGYNVSVDNFNTLENTNTSHTDGNTYCIIKYPTYIREESINEHCDSISVDDDKELMVSNYLSSMLPADILGWNIDIPSKYDVHSIYLDKVISDILDYTFQITVNMSDTALYLKLAPYEYLLKYDVTQTIYNESSEFLEIYPRFNPTILNATALQYNTILRVNSLILSNRVTGLNLYLQII